MIKSKYLMSYNYLETVIYDNGTSDTDLRHSYCSFSSDLKSLSEVKEYATKTILPQVIDLIHECSLSNYSQSFFTIDEVIHLVEFN